MGYPPWYLNIPENVNLVIKIAEMHGREFVQKLYPNMSRDRTEIERLAREDAERGVKTSVVPEDAEKYMRYCIPAYIRSYDEAVAQLDAKQTTSTATIRVKKVEHKGNTHTYQIELSDYHYLLKPYEFIVQIGTDEINLQER